MPFFVTGVHVTSWSLHLSHQLIVVADQSQEVEVVAVVEVVVTWGVQVVVAVVG